MARERLITAFVTIWLAAATAVPAAQTNTQRQLVAAQPPPSSSARAPARPSARPSARPQGRPSARPPQRPTAQPVHPTARPPQRPTAHPVRPTAKPVPPPARPERPITRPPSGRPTAAPWRPNRPPQIRPPSTGWQRPVWANHQRPPWARNNGYRPNYVLVNPRAYAGYWGWNNGMRWSASSNYWGGGFWGPFSLFTFAVGQALWNQNRYVEPGIGSPGWYLFQNYGLEPARCGRHDLVYIYGPNNGVMCAYPNEYVLVGFYYVDPATLELFVM